MTKYGFYKCSSGKHWMGTEDEASRCCNGWVKTRQRILPNMSTDNFWFPRLVPVSEVLKGIPEEEQQSIIDVVLNSSGSIKH